jgi:hypothetical protein
MYNRQESHEKQQNCCDACKPHSDGYNIAK